MTIDIDTDALQDIKGMTPKMMRVALQFIFTRIKLDTAWVISGFKCRN